MPFFVGVPTIENALFPTLCPAGEIVKWRCITQYLVDTMPPGEKENHQVWAQAHSQLLAYRDAVETLEHQHLPDEYELDFVRLFGQMIEVCRRRGELMSTISRLGEETQRTRELMQQIAFYSVELLQLEKRIAELVQQINELFAGRKKPCR